MSVPLGVTGKRKQKPLIWGKAVLEFNYPALRGHRCPQKGEEAKKGSLSGGGLGLPDPLKTVFTQRRGQMICEKGGAKTAGREDCHLRACPAGDREQRPGKKKSTIRETAGPWSEARKWGGRGREIEASPLPRQRFVKWGAEEKKLHRGATGLGAISASKKPGV